MNDVTQFLQRISAGDTVATEQLLPLVYDELRQLAAAKLAHEMPGQTLQATALVHEVYIRLVGNGQSWDNQKHFFAAAATAMRRILIDRARQRRSSKRGGEWTRIDLPELADSGSAAGFDFLDLNTKLTEFERLHPEKFQVVNLMFFTGRSLGEVAQMLGISRAMVRRHWAYARAWLYGQLKELE